MKRLTYKNYIEEYEVNFEKSSDKNWSIAESDTHIKVTGEPIDKLGELEEVLEKFNIDDAAQLDSILNYIRTNTLIDIQNKEILELENANLKSELVELKQKAIVPKFQVGQTLFRIDFGSIVLFLVNEIYGYIKADKSVDINYFDYVGLIIEENDLFATREEAEQKLAEIKGEKDE